MTLVQKKLKTEKQRVADLVKYEVLDTESEVFYDRIAKVAASVMEVPLAAVSLVDFDRIWLKASVGIHSKEIARDISFCTHAIEGEDVFTVSDATRDPRFSKNPMVTRKNGIRFYAGAPLVTSSGSVIGTICILDFVPREMSVNEKRTLANLADVLVEHPEERLRRTNSDDRIACRDTLKR
jgi:GAF domain-containing protein